MNNCWEGQPTRCPTWTHLV